MSFCHKKSYTIPISLREWLVCISASLTLIFTAWSFGGFKLWALQLLFSGGLLTFLASIIPMPRPWNGYDNRHGNLKNFKRLLFSPFFWVGFFFLLYIQIQYINPSIVQVFGEKSWWVEAMTPPLGPNFPSSVKADFESMNALRAFVINASAILLACGILVGIQRRKSALIILWSFVTSGVAMSFIAILQKLSGTKKLLWIVETINPNPWGTFAYRNQAAAFLILVTIISCLLFFYYLKKSKKNLLFENQGPHFLCLLYIFLLFASIWLALSRGGIILGSALALVFAILAIWNLFLNWRFQRQLGSFFLLGVLLLSGFLFFLQFSDWTAIDKRIQHFNEIKSNIETYDRTLSSKATWEMAKDRLAYGWGAGSFRYIFPIYQKNYETIWYHWESKKRGWQGRRIYHYAHNDWLQFLAEYGFVGCFFLSGIFLYLTVSTIKLFTITKSAGCLLFSGILLIFIHNFIDFIFSSPSYWAAFLGSLIVALKLFELENKASQVLK